METRLDQFGGRRKQSMDAHARNSITDVAKASGVSVATVSRVLNGLGGVSEGTALHVRSVMDRLGYKPLRIRRSEPRSKSSQGGTGNLAIITLGEARVWLELPVMAAALNGVRAAIDQQGYRMMLSEVLDPTSPGAIFSRREIDGAIVFISSSFKTESVAAALKVLDEQLPIVWAMGGPLAVDVDHVFPDHHRIGRLAHGYLREHGCRNVAYLTTSPKWELMRVRGHAFLDAACDSGDAGQAFIQSTEEATICSYGRNVIAAPTSAELVGKLVANNPPIDGLFIGNDRTTADLYPLFLRAGLKPGRNIRIVSCDNEEPRLAALDPRPATIDVNAEQIGRGAVEQLLKRIAQPGETALSIQIPPKMVPA